MADAAVAQIAPVKPVQVADNFSVLIDEAYIAPIRSVLVVDDEFPSLDGYLGKAVDGLAGDYKMAPTRLLQKIVKYCRSKARPWLIDVHDPNLFKAGAEAKVASHLHQSDLMILDYHLNGDAGDGTVALEVVRTLAESEHFNLVVVYTKGYKAGGSEQVFFEILSSLAGADYDALSSEEFVRISGQIDEWHEEIDSEDNLFLPLMEQSDYLTERFAPLGTKAGGRIKGAISKLIKDAKREVPFSADQVYLWLVQAMHEKYRKDMHPDPTRLGRVSYARENGVNWIRADSLFLTVVDKSCEPAEIEATLVEALRHSKPGAHQLLMAKMRAQLEQRGAIAESSVLSDVYMQAGWMSELLYGDELKKDELISSAIERHWEALGDRLRPSLNVFGSRLIGYLDEKDASVAMQETFGAVAGEKAKMSARVNAYSNSKPIARDHLSTGHVFTLRDQLGCEEFWLCLSPACDLVPSQKTNGWRANLAGMTPFMAVRLHELKRETALKQVTENLNVFLFIRDDTRAFSFCTEGNSNALPHWEQMFARDGGRLNRHAALSLLRVGQRQFDSEVGPFDCGAIVVAQLRYEYAINLMQRLGNSMTRVGFDYYVA